MHKPFAFVAVNGSQQAYVFDGNFSASRSLTGTWSMPAPVITVGDMAAGFVQTDDATAQRLLSAALAGTS